MANGKRASSSTLEDSEGNVPKARELLWVTLQALVSNGGSGSIQEIEAKVTELGGFTRYQQSVLHKGGPQTELSYEQAWARTLLKAAGAVDNNLGRGVWAITEAGRLLQESDMPATMLKARSGFQARSQVGAAGQRRDVEPSPDVPSSLDDWHDRLLGALMAMPAASFERLSQRLLRESGFLSVQVTGRTGDGGIDGLGVLRINLLSFPVLFQCKRYRGSVGAATVRDFRGAMMGRTDKGIIITTGSFTQEAQREATRDGAPPIDLIDGPQLCELLKELRLGVTTRQVEEVRIENDWFRSI